MLNTVSFPPLNIKLIRICFGAKDKLKINNRMLQKPSILTNKIQAKIYLTGFAS